MNDVEQRVAAKAFAAYWKDKGYEKGESQSFWLSLLRDVFGKEHPEQFILFEEQVHLDLILSILVYTLFSRMFDLMQPPAVKHSIAVV